MSLRLLSIKNASITTKSQKKNVVKKEDRLDDSRGSSSTETSTTSELTSGPKIDVVSTPKSRGITAGSKADSLYMTLDAFAKATGAKDKELFKVEGATAIGTYWVPEHVEAEVGKLKAFYARTLASDPS